MDVRARKSRETSPDRARRCAQPRQVKTLRKVQVLYYLSRNGQLEHPHYMEVSHLANQQLRLKDVIDRLTVLRGRGMPSLFSWSCKRSYKNGYVWNDLSENDVIYPAEGAEYVLKGSEIIEGCADRFQHIHVSNRQHNPEPSFFSKRKYLLGNQNSEEEYMGVEEEEKGSNSSSNTPNSRCSRGVATDELGISENPKNPSNATEISLEDGSPPSSSSTISEKAHNSNSQRFEDSDSGAERSAMTRNSVLLQLFACGSATISGRNAASSSTAAARVPNAPSARKSSSLHKGVLRKTAAISMVQDDDVSFMSENPRFGNPQSEEKEYFSGSIIESMTESRVSEPTLKKSSSYNEERSLKSGMGVEEMEKREEAKKSLKGKCIPRKTCCSKPQKK